MARLFQLTFLLLALGFSAHDASAADAPLVLERKIPLEKVGGRIDHFALDRSRHHLFLAELGNDSVSVVNLATGVVDHRIEGLGEPQGVAYVAETDTLYVANGDDGAVRVFRASDFAQIGKIDLKDDADNVRVDAPNHLVYVGFGSGAVAAIDVRTMAKTMEMRLKAHPESLRLDPAGNRLFVNVPNAHEVAVLDRTSGKALTAWQSQPDARANFPMAVRADGTQIFVGYRSPARLVAFDTKDGRTVFNVPTCGDADDVFLDEKRQRAYVSCGEGVIDVFQTTATSANRIAQLKVSSGARTSFFDAEGDRLFLAVRASIGEPAAIWVYRPQ